ncbi:MAG: hypothetical protein WA799_08215 [Nitrosotalea sp.]
MTNLFKCITCNTIITTEESSKHSCKSIIKQHKVIPALSFFTVVDDNGVLNVVIDGLDHIGYVFEIKEPKLIPLETLPEMCRNLTERKTDKDLTESCSETLNISTLKYGIGT